MRKVLLIILAFTSFTMLQAQDGLALGINAGAPISDTDIVSSIIVGVDAEYMLDFLDETLYAGGTIGFINAFSKDRVILNQTVKFDSTQFIPVAAAARYYFNYTFYVGTDLGYAIGINEGNSGGFYYRPRMGFAVRDNIVLNMSFAGVGVSGSNYQTITFGLEYRL